MQFHLVPGPHPPKGYRWYIGYSIAHGHRLSRDPQKGKRIINEREKRKGEKTEREKNAFHPGQMTDPWVFIMHGIYKFGKF